MKTGWTDFNELWVTDSVGTNSQAWERWLDSLSCVVTQRAP